jgi:hypothetical protein
VYFTTVYMPLVRTPMIAPTKGYADVPALTPEQAASWVVRAMHTRASRVAGPFSGVFSALDEVAPGLLARARNFGYRYTPGSPKAPKKEAPKSQLDKALAGRSMN